MSDPVGGWPSAGRRGPSTGVKPRRDSIPSAFGVLGAGRVASWAGSTGGSSTATAALGGRLAISVPGSEAPIHFPQSSRKDPSISNRRLREAWNLGENRRWPEMDGKKGVKQHSRFQAVFLFGHPAHGRGVAMDVGRPAPGILGTLGGELPGTSHRPWKEAHHV
jgi:hypothetical protein